MKWYLEWVLKLFSLLIIVSFFISGLDRISSEITFYKKHGRVRDERFWKGNDWPILLYAALARSCKSDICVDCRDHSWTTTYLNRWPLNDDKSFLSVKRHISWKCHDTVVKAFQTFSRQVIIWNLFRWFSLKAWTISYGPYDLFELERTLFI